MKKRTYPRTALLVLAVFAAVWPAVEIVLLVAEWAPVSFAQWYTAAAFSRYAGLAVPEIRWPEIVALIDWRFYMSLMPIGLAFGLLPALAVRRYGILSRPIVVLAAAMSLAIVLMLCAAVEGARSGGEGLGPTAFASAGLLWLSYVFSGLICRGLLLHIGVRGYAAGSEPPELGW